MVGVKGRPIFLNWGLREHAPASCYINPGELQLHCVCGGGVVVRMVCVWLNCTKGGVLVMSSRTTGAGAKWGWSRCWAVVFLKAYSPPPRNLMALGIRLALFPQAIWPHFSTQPTHPQFVIFKKFYFIWEYSFLKIFILFGWTGSWGFPGCSVVKDQSASAGDVGSIPGSGRSPVGGNSSSSILDWEIPWTEEPGGLQPMGSQKSWTLLNN